LPAPLTLRKATNSLGFTEKSSRLNLRFLLGEHG
jgi:hypothetical protein